MGSLSVSTMGGSGGNGQYKGQIFKGKVVDNNDPEKMRRVRVEIPQLYGKATPEQLPWAYVRISSILGQTPTVGAFGVLVLDSEVWVELQSGDPKFPVVVGVHEKPGLAKPLSDTNYPNRYGFEDGTGNSVFLDRSDKTIGITTASGITISIDTDGNITMNAPGNVDLTVGGAVTANITDDSTITVPKLTISGDLHTTGNITCDGNVSDSTGSMQKMRDQYNAHKNTNNGNNPPSVQMD